MCNDYGYRPPSRTQIKKVAFKFSEPSPMKTQDGCAGWHGTGVAVTLASDSAFGPGSWRPIPLDRKHAFSPDHGTEI